MSEDDKTLMRRYVYEVTRRVPKEDREEITRDLEELIYDKLEAEKGTMQEILVQLGNPKEFARKYRNEDDFFSRLEYFDTYCLVLKIALACVGIAAFFAYIVTNGYESHNVVELFFESLFEAVGSMAGTFATITIVFFIIEYINSHEKHNSHETTKKKEYQLSKLPDDPKKKGSISRTDSIVGLVLTAFFGIIFLLTPKLLGVYVFEEGEFVRSIPFFQTDKWNIIGPLFAAAFLCGFVDNAVKLIVGRYGNLVLIFNVLTSSIQLILLTIIFKFQPIWNPSFVEDVTKTYNFKATSKGDLLTYWGTERISNVVMTVIWCCVFLEVGVTVYKTIRYGNKTGY